MVGGIIDFPGAWVGLIPFPRPLPFGGALLGADLVALFVLPLPFVGRVFPFPLPRRDFAPFPELLTGLEPNSGPSATMG